MLKQLSRLERTRSTIIIIFAILMGLSLIFFYAPRRDANTLPGTSREAIAQVGDEEITVSDLTQRQEFYQQRFGGQINLGQKRIVNELIQGRVVSQEAARLGLAPSDAELRDAIRKQFTDASGKFVGFDRYKEYAITQSGSVEQFEQQVRDELAQKKLRAFLTAGVSIPDEEVQEEFMRKNTSFDLIYVPVTADELAKKITPSDEELQKFYDEHKEEFRFDVPQKKIRYVFIEQEKVGQKMQISDKELREEYDRLTPENKQKGVRVQQIVLKVARPELDQQVLQKATELTQSIRDEKQMASEEKFAEAARGNSEDPATAKAGGWLPAPVRKDPKKPEELVQSALGMTPGQVGDPLKSGNAYYIFRRGDAVEKTFEEAKVELQVSLRNRQSYRVAADIASRAAAQLKESNDPQQVAQAFAAEANMSAAEMVRETPFVKPGDDVPNIGSAPQFEQAVEPLNNPNDVGDRVSIKGGFAIPLLVEKRDPRVPDFAEVKDGVAERVRRERAQAQVEQAARLLAENAGNADGLKAAAERLGLKADPVPSYKLGTPLPSSGVSPAADEAINKLKAGEIAKTPVKVGDAWVVVGVTKRTDADLAEFAKQRDTLSETALNERRDQIFSDHIEAAQARYDREGKVKIYDDVLARLEASQPSAAPPPVVPPVSGLPMPPQRQ
jgi:peptidyl-prolyl cis-trans isomerase D